MSSINAVSTERASSEAPSIFVGRISHQRSSWIPSDASKSPSTPLRTITSISPRPVPLHLDRTRITQTNCLEVTNRKTWHWMVNPSAATNARPVARVKFLSLAHIANGSRFPLSPTTRPGASPHLALSTPPSSVSSILG